MNPARSIYRRILHAVDRHGLRGLWMGAPYPLSRLSAEQTHPFDLAHGVDTSGCVAGEFLESGHPSDLYNTAYYAISPTTLSQALDHLGLILSDWSRFTFVDLGCGKGRALLAATGFAFQRLIGVEISPTLAKIARENIQTFAAAPDRFEIIEADAATYEFPQTALVVFLYHPFLAPVLRQVLSNLERSATDYPRAIYLLYANPSYTKVFASYPFLTHVWDYSLPLSAEDAAADRHGITHERYTLYQHLA